VRLKSCFLLAIIGLSAKTYAQRPLKPFPQHTRYFAGVIRPNHISQQALDKAVAGFYDQWKLRYIKNVPGKPQSFVWFEGKAANSVYQKVRVMG